jgi:hypothetical protein
MIALLLALACAPKPQALPAGFDPKAGPLLPAMEAPIYASGQSVPKDVLVSQVALGLKWDEALSGAAAAMALLDGQPLTLEAAQHAAYRAGYPYPVQRMSMGWMEAGVYPDELGRSLAATLQEGDQIGLARARTGDRDRWVALIARPVDALSPISRELRLGAEVPIRTRTPCTWTLVSPRGQVQTGMTPAMVALEEAGEWWLEVRTLNATVASIPLYVDMATPKGPCWTCRVTRSQDLAMGWRLRSSCLPMCGIALAWWACSGMASWIRSPPPRSLRCLTRSGLTRTAWPGSGPLALWAGPPTRCTAPRAQSQPAWIRCSAIHSAGRHSWIRACAWLAAEPRWGPAVSLSY